MASIEQMPKGAIAKALFKALKGTNYEIDMERAGTLARFHDDPKWVPSLQKMMDGKFKSESK